MELSDTYSPYTLPKARLNHSSIKFTLLYPEGSLAEERPENLGPTPQTDIFPRSISLVKLHQWIWLCRPHAER